MPAHYGDESFVMTRTSDLKGSEFFAYHNINGSYSCYSWAIQRVWFYNPTLIFDSIAKEEKGWKKKCIFFYPGKENISVLNDMNYIINSIQTKNIMEYVIDFNPISEWLDNKKDISLVYTNGFFEINFKK